MPKKKEITVPLTVNIRITRETRDILTKLRNHYSETYDSIIVRLIKFFKEKNDKII